MQKIEFLCPPDLEGKIPVPQRASKFLPDWYRNLPRDMGMPDANGLPGLSAKACLPMADLFSLGFIIPLPFDIQINVFPDGLLMQFDWDKAAPFRPLETHMPTQLGAPNPPFERARPLKFINPWRIKVPDGYSVLFTHPFNHAELPFNLFSGLVDCDRFETTVNFPFQFTGGPGLHTLPAGLPMAQLVPIKRDMLIGDAVVRASTTEETAEQDAANARKYGEANTYAKDWRQTK